MARLATTAPARVRVRAGIASRPKRRGVARLALATLVAAATLGDPLAAEAADPPVAGSITSNATAVAPPETFQLTGTASGAVDGFSSTYWMRIYDVTGGAHNLVKICASGSSCTATVQAAWNWNDNPVPRAYRIEVGPSASSTVAVDVTRTSFSPQISANPTSIRAGDSTEVTGTIALPLAGSPYWMRIVEVGVSTRKNCTTGSTCASVETSSLSLNDNPQPKSYKLTVGRSDGSGYIWESTPVTVDVQRTEFNPILVAGSYNVSVGRSIELTGTIARTIDNTGYWMRIVDLDRGTRKNCTAGTTCTVSEAVGWSDNANPQLRRYKLTVGRSDGAGYIWESPIITVNIMPVWFGVDIGATETAPDTNGNKRWTLTATADRTIDTTGYWLRLQNAAGSAITNCTAGTTCEQTNVGAGRYRAVVVKSSTGQIFGKSFLIDLTSSGAVVLGDGYVDFVEAAGNWSSVEEFCIDVAAFGSHTTGASVSDQWLQTCSSGNFTTVEAAMLSLLATPQGRTVLATVIVLAGAVTTVAWQNATQAGTEPTATPTPEPSPTPTAAPPSPPPTPTSPVPATDGFGINYKGLEQDLIDKNGSALDQQIQAAGAAVSVKSAVSTIARECIARVQLAGSGAESCDDLPIFASGFDVSQATQWDMTALGDRIIPGVPPHPEWALLDYTRTERSPHYWKYAYPETEAFAYSGFAMSCKGADSDDSGCHEFPFLSTTQGGEQPSVLQRPFLKIINQSAHNGPQGSRLNGFYSSCGIQAAEAAGQPTRFIVTPQMVLPTLRLCNR